MINRFPKIKLSIGFQEYFQEHLIIKVLGTLCPKPFLKYQKDFSNLNEEEQDSLENVLVNHYIKDESFKERVKHDEDFYISKLQFNSLNYERERIELEAFLCFLRRQVSFLNDEHRDDFEDVKNNLINHIFNKKIKLDILYKEYIGADILKEVLDGKRFQIHT